MFLTFGIFEHRTNRSRRIYRQGNPIDLRSLILGIQYYLKVEMSQQDIIRVVFGAIENNCGLKITLEQPEIELAHILKKNRPQ